MKFYHVDLCKKEVINLFIPKIPSHILDGENGDIKRICVSSTIKGALGSVPWGGRNMANKGENMVFRVYEFESSSIDKKSILTPKELVENGYVPDALCYDEHWIMEPVKPNKIYHISIESYYEVSDDYFTSDFYNLTSEELDSEDFCIEDYYLGCCTLIDDLVYNIIPDKDILSGNTFNIDIQYISNLLGSDLNDYDLEEEINWIIDDFISADNEIEEIREEENTLIIETRDEEGLHLDLFIKNIIERIS